MEDLRALIDKIEQNRKRREWVRFGTAFGAGLAVLAFIFVFFPRPEAPVAVEPATPLPSVYDSVILQAKAAVVLDLATGEVLYEMNADAQLPLASLTKLLTVYAGIQALGAGTVVPITSTALLPEGDSGFLPGEEFAFSEIAKAALVASSNDAAEAIALLAEERRALPTASVLANAATAAGLLSTYALNGTGLDESVAVSGGYGSAKDVAKLAGALLERARPIAQATTQPTLTISSLSGNTFTYKNTNPVVGAIPGLMLSKTGYTDLAGGNLAVIFDAGINHPVAVVVMGSSIDGRFTDTQKLIRATLDSFIAPLP
jgi:serine-type D-Ala-D-Ala carboxypeptidase (penicillin-binding protein 5/6)